MIGIASGMLKGHDDNLTPDRVARGNIDAIREAGLPRYGNVWNLDAYRDCKHVAELLVKDFPNE